jgi:hypothetical protein
MKSADYEEKAIVALKLVVESSRIDFKNLERNSEIKYK